jgi:hypothetical protein
MEDCITLCAAYNSAGNHFNGNLGFNDLCSGVEYRNTIPNRCASKSGVTSDATRLFFAGEVGNAVLQWPAEWTVFR